MGQPKVTTDRKWKAFRSREEMPPKILTAQFDWTDEGHEKHGDYSHGFVLYRRTWYHLSQFMRGGVDGWDGAHGDSYFSGVVIKVSRDGETYQIGTYTA